MGKKEFVISQTVVVISVIVVIALLVTEGLLIGFLAVPKCDDNPTDPGTPTTPIKTETPTTPETTARTTTPSVPDGPWNNNRLPKNLNPISYDVTLRPVLEKVDDTYWFYGSSSVRYMCMNATDYIILHSITLIYPDQWSDFLTIVDVADNSEQKIVDVMFYQRNAYMVVTVESPCIETHTYEMRFSEFHGELGDDLDGLYRSEYVNANGQLRVIATTQMQADGARQTFPCFDEPSFKATFTIRLLFRDVQGYSAISNMAPESSRHVTIDGAQWNETTFGVTPKMSTYLLAMVVSDFEYEETFSREGIQTRIYARPVPVQNGEVTYASVVSPQILDHLADYYNVSYPLPKSDQLAVPDFGAGAMENWGLVIYREVYLLYNDNSSSVYNKYSVVQVIAHELAHQWFGNLVTCAWWSDIWLNEGFASYVQYIGVEGVYQDWKLDELFVVDDLQRALSSDAYSSSHPLHHPEGFFSTITYSKGGSFLRMVRNFLGEETFTRALTRYLKDFAYDVVDYNDLIQYWIDQAEADGLGLGENLKEMFESWILQMGYPLIKVSFNANPFALRLSQEYFLIDKDDTPVNTPGSEVYGYKWWVPILLRDGKDMETNDTTDLVLSPNADTLVTIALDEEFSLVNVDAVGYYRVAYEDGMWQAIVARLRSSNYTQFSPQNRAQLIDDVFAIARSGRANVSIESAFDITRYLDVELEYIPWKTFLDNMVDYDRLLGGSSIFGEFSKYLVDLLDASIYAEYGWIVEDTSDSAQVERMTVGIAIEGACHYGHENCIQRAVARYLQWMNNPNTNTISTTYRTEVYCTSIREGGIEEWDFAWEKYLTVDSAQEKTNLRYAMSCSKDPAIINRYIERCLNSTLVRNQDVSATMSYIGSHEHSKYVAWNYAMNNWDLLMSTVGSGPTSSMLSSARRRFSTRCDLNLIDLLRPIAGPAWEGTLNSYYNSVVDNIEWREENEARIGNWLTGGSSTYASSSGAEKPKIPFTKFKNVDHDVISEDRGFMKRF